MTVELRRTGGLPEGRKEILCTYQVYNQIKIINSFFEPLGVFEYGKILHNINQRTPIINIVS